MQTTRKVGLVLRLNPHLRVQKRAWMTPLVQDLQQDLQKLHPSMQGSERKYHQMLSRK